MGKKLIIALIFILPAWGIAQKANFQRYSLPEVSKDLGGSLNSYVGGWGKELRRNGSLDSCAKLRANYFLDVFQKNSESGKSVSDMMDHIPKNHNAHDQCFGNSMYFEPPTTKYPKPFVTLPNLGLEVKGEIMQEISWEKSYKNKQDFQDIVNLSISSIKGYYRNTISNLILNGYKESELHNLEIKKRGDGDYGISTRILISEKRVGDLWKYEVLIYNVIVFTGGPA